MRGALPIERCHASNNPTTVGGQIRKHKLMALRFIQGELILATGVTCLQKTSWFWVFSRILPSTENSTYSSCSFLTKGKDTHRSASLDIVTWPRCSQSQKQVIWQEKFSSLVALKKKKKKGENLTLCQSRGKFWKSDLTTLCNRTFMKGKPDPKLVHTNAPPHTHYFLWF